jgi:hypothetical protein
VLLVAAAAGGWWAFLRDDGPARSALPEVPSGSVGTIPPAASGVADPVATSLAELMAKGRELTFHATYDVTGDAQEGTLTVEVWRADGRIRQDTTLVTDTTTVRTAGFVLDDKTLTCTQRDSQPWACSSAADPGTNPDGLFGSVAAELAGAQVAETEETVADRDARCFTFPTGEGEGSLCFTPEGLPLRLVADGQQMLLREAADEVDDAVFEPPAEP